MIKKLDKLILKAFIGPFIATFFITLFVLVMQFFWKYIDDLVGKGLDFLDIMELTGYVTVTVIPYTLPISILLSSIMTFGNLGESFELVAIKSAGIPLLRFMRPLLIAAFFIATGAFMISNYVMPVANLKFTTMLYDIRVAKPAFDIKEGIFYDKLPGFAIKVGQKDPDGNTIRDVIIYENQYSLQDNIIIAEKGVMRVSEDRKFLEFDLENGWRYQENGPYNTKETDYYRLGFKKYKKSFDLSSFDVLKTPDSMFKRSYQMLNIKQLQKATDSINKDIRALKTDRMSKEVMSQLMFAGQLEKGWDIGKQKKKTASYFDRLPDSTINVVYNRAADKLNIMKSSNQLIVEDYSSRSFDLRLHQIEWHKKFSLSFACIVLFVIGAPLGSIIRKGGLGMPLVVAVSFFLVFHLLNMFGEKFVRQEIMTPFFGIWLPSLVLLPVGCFLVYKAMNDSQLFNNEFYFRLFRQFKAFLNRKKRFDMKTNRRNFIRTGVLAGTALGIVPTQLMASSSEDLQLAPFKQAPLPYAYGALEPIIDAMTMEIHYTKHAAAYTKNLNDAYAAEVKNGQPSLEDILKNSSNYSMKMRNNGGGHFNHELFWKCMQPSGGALQDGLLKEAIQRDLGGYDQMKNKLTEAAMTRFGSGWAWIYLDNNKRLQIGSTPNQDNPLMDASPIKGFPILGLDVWEHAYYLKYQNRRADYVSNWFGLVNWKMVEQQYETGWKRTL